ncbi:MAG: patatin-like phospholipase family protein [Actinomycetota bacterium]
MTSEAPRTVSRVQWLRRLALRRNDRVAFVLSGGGPYGAMQVGMLQALVEAGISPDLVVGTSAGSLNAAFVAADPSRDGIANLATIWRGLSDEDLFPGAKRRSSWARMIMKGDRIFENSGLQRIITEQLGISTFEELHIPLGVVATELEDGHEELFRSGDLVAALLASSAMPGIFPPIDIEGKRYIDGGVTNAVPIAPAIEMGAHRIYVLNCSGSQQEKRPLYRPMDHLLHAFLLSRSRRYHHDLPVLAQRAELVVIPTPQVEFSVSFTSMAHTGRLIELGYEAAARFLAGGQEDEHGPGEAAPLV